LEGGLRLTIESLSSGKIFIIKKTILKTDEFNRETVLFQRLHYSTWNKRHDIRERRHTIHAINITANMYVHTIQKMLSDI
jgi:hypothetical protein